MQAANTPPVGIGATIIGPVRKIYATTSHQIKIPIRYELYSTKNWTTNVNTTNQIDNNNNRTKRATVASPSQAVGYQPGRLIYTSIPPFPISFFVLRVNVNAEFTQEVCGYFTYGF